MTERWKRWKAKSGLSTVSTAPWKSRTPREISTFPQLGRTADGKSGKPKPGFPLFPRAIRDYESGWRVPKPRRSGPAASRRSRAKMQRKPPSFGRQKGYRQFRPISGSLFDWKMLGRASYAGYARSGRFVHAPARRSRDAASARLSR